MYEVLTVAQVRSNKIIMYDEFQGNRTNSSKNVLRISNMTEQRKNRYSGTMTQGAKKRLAKAIELMCMSIKPTWMFNPISGRPHLHRLSFITLTISENKRNLTATEGYKTLLRPFLQWLTKYRGVNTYVWKAELQRRGQLHYHITTPSFIRYDELRDKWNQLQQKAGLLDDFIEKHGHANPNSTDVHETYKIKNLSAYLCKYLTKEVAKATKEINENENKQDPNNPEDTAQHTRTTGKIWDCSKNLKSAKFFKFDVSQFTYNRLNSAIHDEKVLLINTERCSIFNVVKGNVTDFLSDSERDMFQLHLKAIRENLRDQDEITPTAPAQVTKLTEPSHIIESITAPIGEKEINEINNTENLKELELFSYWEIPKVNLS